MGVGTPGNRKRFLQLRTGFFRRDRLRELIGSHEIFGCRSCRRNCDTEVRLIGRNRCYQHLVRLRPLSEPFVSEVWGDACKLLTD